MAYLSYEEKNLLNTFRSLSEIERAKAIGFIDGLREVSQDRKQKEANSAKPRLKLITA